jgi:hypothetical protein
MNKLILLAALTAFSAFAQSAATCNAATPAVCGAGLPQSDVQIKPQAVPTSTTVVATYDAYLKTVTVANTTAGALTFTLADRQASPIAAMAAVSIAANTSYVIVWPALYWSPGGFTVLASGSGLTYFAAWKQ